MPHQCTTCDRTFPDGSKEMLGGCPGCGGNKFQFLPSGAPDGAAGRDRAGSPPSAPAADPAASDPSAPATESSARDPAPPTARGPRPSPESEPAPAGDDAPEPPSAPPPGAQSPDAPEDAAQASARRSLVSREELPSVDDRAAVLEEVAGDARPGEPEPERRPDLETLRRELNDQFESIKILEPGQYELNLMELYDREEYIIALEEDGRYVIDVPTRWAETPDD